MVEELAEEYRKAGKPVVFLEHAVIRRVGNRLDRWYAAYDGSRMCGVPFVIVDSGWKWTCGGEDFRAVYSAMVDEALGRSAGAELEGRYERDGDDLRVEVHVKNLSGTALGPSNDATVNVIVFERTKVIHTTRYVRAAAFAPIAAPLDDGEEGVYEVSLAHVVVGDWDRTQIVVLLDYRAFYSAVNFTALQAAIATDIDSVTPTASETSIPFSSPTPTSETTQTPAASATVSATVSATASATASAAASAAASVPVSRTASSTGTPTPDATTTAGTETATPTWTRAASETAGATRTRGATPSHTATAEAAASPTSSHSATPRSTDVPSPAHTSGPAKGRAYLPFVWRGGG